MFKSLLINAKKKKKGVNKMTFDKVVEGAFMFSEIGNGEPFEVESVYYLKLNSEINDGEGNTLSFNAANLLDGTVYQFEPEDRVSKLAYELNFYEYTGEPQESTEE